MIQQAKNTEHLCIIVDRGFPMQVVKWATIVTAATFVMLQIMFNALPDEKLTLSAISFCWVEICLGYNTEAFWVLVEESCNIQQVPLPRWHVFKCLCAVQCL